MSCSRRACVRRAVGASGSRVSPAHGPARDAREPPSRAPRAQRGAPRALSRRPASTDDSSANIDRTSLGRTSIRPRTGRAERRCERPSCTTAFWATSATPVPPLLTRRSSCVGTAARRPARRHRSGAQALRHAMRHEVDYGGLVNVRFFFTSIRHSGRGGRHGCSKGAPPIDLEALNAVSLSGDRGDKKQGLRARTLEEFEARSPSPPASGAPPLSFSWPRSNERQARADEALQCV